MIVIPEPSQGLPASRLELLHPDRLGGFRLDGHHWTSPAHYCLARALARDEDRERVRGVYAISEARQLAAECPAIAISEEAELDTLRSALTAALETSLSRRALLLETGDAPIEARLGEDVRWGVGVDGSGENLLGRALMDVRAYLRVRASDPAALQCQHQDAEEREVVCEHRFASLRPDAERAYHRRYTGVEGRYEVLCEACAQRPPEARPLRFVCRECFSGFRDGARLADLGTPEIRERKTSLHFTHRTCPAPAKIIAFVPIPRQPHTWLLLDAEGRFHRLDTERGVSEPGGRIEPGALALSESPVLVVSPGGELAAVGEARGTRGVVLEPASGKVALTLVRGDYHVKHCRFPLGFFELDGRLLLVHATDWNRLDVSDPRTGERLTRREQAPKPEGAAHPLHTLDYFHSDLRLSPGGTRVLDNGWVWHPVGSPRVFSLERWLRENPWESEDGPSVRSLAWRAYYWDGPVAWLDERTVVLWGDGEDELELAPAALIRDAETGKELRRFLGPGEGFAVIPPYLVAFDPWARTSVWDPVSGERLAHDPDFCPAAAHPLSHDLLSLEGDVLRMSRLLGAP